MGRRRSGRSRQAAVFFVAKLRRPAESLRKRISSSTRRERRFRRRSQCGQGADAVAGNVGKEPNDAERVVNDRWPIPQIRANATRFQTRKSRRLNHHANFKSAGTKSFSPKISNPHTTHTHARNPRSNSLCAAIVCALTRLIY